MAVAVELCCFGQRQFEQLLQEQPALKQLFREPALDAVDAARDWMLLLGCISAEERVATLIHFIARRMQASRCEPCAQRHSMRFDLPLSRTDVAEHLGLRIGTISRQLKRLRAAGVVETSSRRSLAVRDLAALERAVESECG